MWQITETVKLRAHTMIYLAVADLYICLQNMIDINANCTIKYYLQSRSKV